MIQNGLKMIQNTTHYPLMFIFVPKIHFDFWSILSQNEDFWN